MIQLARLIFWVPVIFFSLGLIIVTKRLPRFTWVSLSITVSLVIFVCKILEYSYEMADALLNFYFLGFLLSASLLGYIFYLRTRKR
ncbi:MULTISPECIES: hypothetical protein [unclassified Enterococcus]|uniref:hypothetical protein n=1 Tax=unclassified Enterococcus TaxID=2608891 RepID=UPI0019055F23|nr:MULTISPECIES: hypothetical protein [unclassified Enterococcus]MBK0036434.1 hypothetical protein [Enterococcus sp. S52]MBK0069092.1 hypothetical protein [Enterococcus sp. S53]MBK0139685.1 hypothetical protein [Enterococcus sp. S76]MBK0143320.1 hypothetical protein [Enterococcus sp. S77]